MNTCQTAMRSILSVVLILFGTFAFSAPVTEALAQRAVSNWLVQNGIAKKLFPETTLGSLVAYNAATNLWIARLSPQGYVVLSGSDLRKPIIAFSKNNYATPEEGSPFKARLDASAAAIATAEAAGGTTHEGWIKLLAKARAAVDVDDSNIIVEPFMNGTHWNQWQPYNDFSPVWDPDLSLTQEGYEIYRGRTPCGCVATAFAQVMAYWQWPARIDDVCSYTHQFFPNAATTNDFTVRFDGNVPLDWDALSAQYVYYKNGYDLRGKVNESVRFPIARLMLFADNLAKMYFTPSGSGANFGIASSSAGRWYEGAVRSKLASEYATAVNLMKSDLQAKRPVLVCIPGHAIVTHGWAEDAESGAYYVYHNYGYSGNGDGWFLLTGNENPNEDLEECYTGFYPRKMVQVDPLPAVVGTTATLSWHLPNCYADKVSSFNIQVQSPGDVGTWDICSSTLSFDPCYEATHSFSSSGELTSSSKLSLSFRHCLTLDVSVEVQASFDNADWQTLASYPLKRGYSSFESLQKDIALGEYAGKTVKFRLAIVRASGTYYNNSSRSIDITAISVSNAKEFQVVENRSVTDVSARETTFTTLETGKKYAFTLTPSFTDNTVGETTSPLFTRAGAASEINPMPEILSVTSSPNSPRVAEGFYRENALGDNVLWVTCSKSVTTLKARPSHLSLLSDDEVTVHKLGDGEFAVELNAKASKIPNRSRMILTLEARNANGTAVYKDLSLRFDSNEADPESYVSGEVSDTSLFANYALKMPAAWLVKWGLANGDSSDYAAVARADADGDGLSNLAEYVCGTSPTNDLEKLTCSIEMVDGKPHVTYAPHKVTTGFKAVLKGTENLETPDWQNKTDAHRFFKVVIERDN